ncbi:MAG TPA: galactose-1-phosphate uridylyltransferase [Chitinophagaceae bacterium]|nr:galactose-1-phosphate uridylyltransferase [Chitinophagaceae bacterium]
MMHETKPYGNWEKRWHPLRREWVVYAAHRNSRPWNFDKKESVTAAPEYDPTCYLCPGNKRISGKKNSDYADVFIFEIDHPVVGLNSPAIPEEFQSQHNDLYKKSQAGGIAKVVCYDPRHNVTLNDISVEKVANVFRALRKEMNFFNKHETIKSVLIFENKGELVGVSNPHPHCQIYAVDFIINVVQKELAAAADYQKGRGTNIFSDIITAEKKDDIRIIAENKGAIAFIPFFARFAYETYVFPKNRHATLITMSDEELHDLAEVFQKVTKKFDANFKSSFPYIMVFAQAPVDGNDYPDYHMHLIICPPLRQPGIIKYLAGPETGADTFMADTMPEEKAAELRNVNL